MKKVNPHISIILPTYNGDNQIDRAISSVQEQSFQDWELIVVIDGSTDTTCERVSKMATEDSRIIIVNNVENQGIQKTLNIGLQKARGKYIARIDDDDEWVDIYKLQKQFDFLESHPEYVLVGTGLVLVDKQKKELTRYLFPGSDYEIRNKILSQNCFAHPTIMFRRNALNLLDGYSEDEKYKHVEDYELWLRMGTIGKFANLPIYAVGYQVSVTSISGKNKLLQLKKCIKLSWEFKNKYPSFLKNFINVNIRYLLYFFIGGVLDRYPKVRAVITSIYKS